MDDDKWKEKIEQRLEDLRKVNHEQSIILAKMEIIFEKNTLILLQHENRSTTNESRLDMIELSHIQLGEAIIAQKEALDRHFAFLKGAGWVVGSFITLLSVYVAIVKVL